jgi:hypothetical protein
VPIPTTPSLAAPVKMPWPPWPGIAAPRVAKGGRPRPTWRDEGGGIEEGGSGRDIPSIRWRSSGRLDGGRAGEQAAMGGAVAMGRGEPSCGGEYEVSGEGKRN